MLKIKDKKGKLVATLEDEDEVPQFIKDKKDKDEDTDDERKNEDEEV